MTREKTYWICQLGGWGAYVLANTLLVAVLKFDLAFSWVNIVSNAWIGVLGLGLTHAYRAFAQRQRWVTLGLFRLIPRILVGCVSVALVMSTGAWLVLRLLPFDQFNVQPAKPGVFFVTLFNLSATILLWSLIYFGVHYFWNYKAAEVEQWRLKAGLKESELKALKSQINPHFLFNSLNSVRALILEDPVRAQEVVTQLAVLLRYGLQSSSTTTVPLATELRIVRHYLDLEGIRLEERLRYTIDVDDDVLEAHVPPMLLQTLVENGIKHGVALLPGGGTITVRGWMAGGMLRLSVSNSGTMPAKPSRRGVGLRNARDRLSILFADRASLTVRQDTASTVRADVTMPMGEDAFEPEIDVEDDYVRMS